jgi:DNA polymerase-3 subunit delta'
MSFQEFYGNAETVQRFRSMLQRERLPHAVILHGPAGSGKYTLAQMLAKAANCLHPTRRDGLTDFCGACENCARIALSDGLKQRVAEAVEAREALREADKKETRIFVQSHADVLVIPPDPPQKMIKVDQVRRVIQNIYFRPSAGRRRFFIFTESSFMKEAAHALLKVLEEPPEFATLLLLTTNPGELLPTIRSRCVTFGLKPLPQAELELLLARLRPEVNPAQRTLIAGLCEGAVGQACSFELAHYISVRKDALQLLAAGSGLKDHTPLFKATEAYRSGAEGKDAMVELLRVLHALLADLLYLNSGAPQRVRNRDILAELEGLARNVDFAALQKAVQYAQELENGMRRNLLRPLALEAFAASLEPH